YLCDDWWFSCSSDYRYHSRGCHVYWNAAFTRGVIIAGGGLSNLFADLMEINPNLVTPFGDDGSLSASYVSSYWILVGVGVIGLPQIAVRAMSYKDSKSCTGQF